VHNKVVAGFLIRYHCRRHRAHFDRSADVIRTSLIEAKNSAGVVQHITAFFRKMHKVQQMARAALHKTQQRSRTIAVRLEETHQLYLLEQAPAPSPTLCEQTRFRMKSVLEPLPLPPCCAQRGALSACRPRRERRWCTPSTCTRARRPRPHSPRQPSPSPRAERRGMFSTKEPPSSPPPSQRPAPRARARARAG